MTKISQEFAAAMVPVGKALFDFGQAAIQATSGMLLFNNKHYEPSDGSYPPDMDME